MAGWRVSVASSVKWVLGIALLCCPALAWGQDLQIAGRIAFQTDRTGNTEIFIMNADTP